MRSFYFTYFATLGIVVPYFGLYYQSLGMTPIEIGVLVSIIPLVRPLFAWAWTYPADQIGWRHEANVVACTLAAAAFAFYFIPVTFAGLLVATFALAVVWAPTLAFAEAATLEDVHRSGIPYGRVRVWGSLGFIAASWGFGGILDRAGVRLALAAALAFAVMNASSSLLLPRPTAQRPALRTSLRAFLLRPGVLLFYAAAMLMQVSHGAYYTFFSIHMAEQGHSGAAIGSLWAVAVVSEMVVLVGSRRLLSMAKPSSLLAACFLLAAARWGLFAASSSLAVAIPAQILHAFTYAAFHLAAVTATHRIFPEDLRASGQAVYGGVTYGFGSVAGSMMAGLLYGAIGPFRLFAACGLIALAGAAIIGRATGRLPAFDDPEPELTSP